jgi:hypothetical protein
MTEREYIETIRRAASDYIDVIRAPESHADGWNKVLYWGTIKEKLSAHLTIRMCDVLLEKPE